MMLKLVLLALSLGAPLADAIALQQTSHAQLAPAAIEPPSPAEQRIAADKQQLARDPKHTEAYTDLVLAYVRRARETANPAWFQNAQEALAKGLQVSPGDFQLEKASVALLLGSQKFPEALAQASNLNAKNPDDVTLYGYMAEADIALGKYGDADRAAQWMLNMRPNNIPGLLLGAELRVIYGDPSGALEFLNQAFGETPQVEPEELAWIANRIALVDLRSGQTDRAVQILARAEQLFPHYPVTAKNLATARLTQQRPAVASTTGPVLAEAAHPLPLAEPAMPITLSRDPAEVSERLLVPRPTSTDRNVKKMQAQVAAHPQDAAAYAGLGAAFFQRARETGDVEDYNFAEQALTRSLDLVSTDLTATAPLETMAEVCMGEHRFADALAYAQKALALGSGDLSSFALVGDAYADMGQYEKAGVAYSHLQATTSTPLNARKDYAQVTRTAYLAFVTGDTEGAIAQMQNAVSEGLTAHLPGENLAWLYFELGEFYYQAGRVQPAADAYFTALTVYPGDYRALAGLGKVRANQGKYTQAITLYQSAIAIVPMPIYIAELGDIYARIGNQGEAEKQYKLVEYIGRLGHINQVLHNRDLALFYADHDRNLDESLRLARKEFEVRSDIYTWDTLAWSLYKNGKLQDAAEASTHALRLGTKDATLLFHAGMISARLGQQAQAAEQLAAVLKINPHFDPRYAEVAKRQLESSRGHTESTSSTPPGNSAALTNSAKSSHVQ